MQPFLRETGLAASLPQPNVDTDVIMPKQFLKRIDREGLAEGAFHDLRFDARGARRPEFILNHPGYERTRFLICGENFGCGSSREHAVWGLMQIGIRAIIAPSFAGIFFGNCEKNGLLAITLPAERVAELHVLAAEPNRAALAIDLEAQTIQTGSGGAFGFEIEASRRRALLSGDDHVQSTLNRAEDIRAFETAHLLRRPWLARRS